MEYTVETLAHGTKVCINKTHRFGTDAFLLSHFAEVKYAQKALDMGTGCGIIPLRWKDMGHKGEAFGLEIDPQGTQLMKKSIELNGFENLTALCGDVREFKTEKADFDMISRIERYTFGTGAEAKIFEKYILASKQPMWCAIDAKSMGEPHFSIENLPEPFVLEDNELSQVKRATADAINSYKQKKEYYRNKYL